MTRCSACRQAGSEPAVLVLGGFPSTCARAAAQTPALLQGTKALAAQAGPGCGQEVSCGRGAPW